MTAPVDQALYACADTYVGLARSRVELQERTPTRGTWRRVADDDPRIARSVHENWSRSRVEAWPSWFTDHTSAARLTARACWNVNTSDPFKGTFRWVRRAVSGSPEAVSPAFQVQVS